MANLSNISPPVRWDISNLKSQHIWHEIAIDTWSRTSDAQHMEYDKCSETLHTFQVTRETHDDEDMLFSDDITWRKRHVILRWHIITYMALRMSHTVQDTDVTSYHMKWTKAFEHTTWTLRVVIFTHKRVQTCLHNIVSDHMVQRTLCIYSTNTYLCTHTCAQLLTAILRKWKDCFCSHSDAWPFPFTHSVEAQCKIVLSLFTKSKMYILTIFLPVNAPHYLPETHFNIS